MRFLFFVFAIMFSAFANSATVSLTWSSPTQREDGAAITDTEISFYTITMVNNLGEIESINFPNSPKLEYVKEIAEGAYSFAISVTDIYDLQSKQSEPQTITVRPINSNAPIVPPIFLQIPSIPNGFTTISCSSDISCKVD